MNYRPAFHAGNFADVFKHAILTMLVEHLGRKDKPFAVLDTHAGVGRYDLRAEAAERTGEYRDGIARLLDAPDPPACLDRYLGIVRDLNRGGRLRFYPGSPWIARAMLRPGDRLELAELHPVDAATLAAEMRGDRRVRVHAMDGYAMLKSFLPPRERRGLVLIDPPFEARDEFARLARGLAQACRRWATGLYAVWYPVKEPDQVARFRDAVRAAPLPPALDAEFRVGEADAPGLRACGLLLLNPPWLLEEQLRGCLPFLARLLAQGPGAGWRLEWLRRERAAAGL